MTAILHKRNSTSGLPPSPSSLSAGEIAINIADGNLFTKTTSGLVKTFLNSENDPYVLNNPLSSIIARNGGNSVTGLFAGALGGYNNNVSGSGSSVVNGESNQVSGDYAAVVSGLNNLVGLQGDYSAVLGGKNNTLNHPESFILGSNITSHLSGFTYVNNLSVLGKIYGDGSGLTGINSSGSDQSNFLPLSGGTMTGKLVVGYTSDEAGINIGTGTVPLSPAVGDLWIQQYSLNWRSAVGTHAAALTNGANIFNRRQVISINDGGDALRITQTGGGNALLIEDSTNPDATPFVVDGLGSVGIGLSSLSEVDASVKLTVVGNVSSTGTLYAAEGSSELWSDVYTTVQANSSNWGYQGADLKALSADWQSAYSTVQSNSASWININSSFSALLGNNVTNPLTATHNLNTKDIIFSVREVATDKIVQAAGRAVDNNNLELTFNSIPTINQYDLTVLSNGGSAGTGGGSTNGFALVSVTTTSYIQVDTYTHNLYDDTTAGGQISVTLLPPANHIGVTQHKKIGSTANVVLSAPSGATIDGYPTYTLMNQYESIGLYTDGTNYFIQ